MLAPTPKEPGSFSCEGDPARIMGRGDISVNITESVRAKPKFTDWSEGGVYDTILSAYKQGIEEDRDLCIEGSYLSISLFREGAGERHLHPDILRNSLILLLALFYPIEAH